MSTTSIAATGFSLGVAVTVAIARTRLLALLSGEQSTLEAKVKALIASVPVVIFSKSYCPYCRQTKMLFRMLVSEGLLTSDDVHITELDLNNDGAAMQDCLHKTTGQRSVPNIWIGGEFIGGNDDIQELYQSGALVAKLKALKK